MQLSIIIPTLNEAENIGNLLNYLQSITPVQQVEYIVVDGGSNDKTIDIAQKKGAKTYKSPQKGRGFQLNFGARKAKAPLLYFVHADTLPPQAYWYEILKALEENYEIGCFRFRFRSSKPMLKINAFFTRFDLSFTRGGDQTLFVTRQLFEELNGFRNDYKIMEDFDFIKRARAIRPFKIMPKATLVSARKYDNNSWLRVQIANLIVFNMWRWGYSQDRMLTMYKKLLRQ